MKRFGGFKLASEERKERKAKNPLDRVHMDEAGPTDPDTNNNSILMCTRDDA